MTTKEWLTCSDLRALLTETPSPPKDKVFAYWRRESYIEDHFQGIIFVPRRKVQLALQSSSFSFVPSIYRQRIVKHAKVQFLGRPFCSFGSLTCWGHRYSDSGNITKAERRVDDNGWEREQYITVDASFLASYSRNYGFIPLLVVDSRRFSEYSIAEVGVNDGWEEISGESFRYSLYTGSNKRPANRPRMTSRSIIYGKRLLFMDECRK